MNQVQATTRDWSQVAFIKYFESSSIISDLKPLFEWRSIYKWLESIIWIKFNYKWLESVTVIFHSFIQWLTADWGKAIGESRKKEKKKKKVK